MQYIQAILIFIGILAIPNLLEDTKARFEVSGNQPSDYSDAVGTIAYHDENVCASNSEFFDIQVAVRYIPHSPEIEFAGQWRPAENLILLNERSGVDIDTVAHEVYHMVETKMKEYKVADPHYGAYLQGAFTNCVWTLVEQDVIEASQPRFRFAN